MNINDLKNLIKNYDDGLYTDSSVEALLVMDSIAIIMNALQKDGSFLVFQSSCRDPGSKTINLSVDVEYHPDNISMRVK